MFVTLILGCTADAATAEDSKSIPEQLGDSQRISRINDID